VDFGHDTICALGTVADLVNTAPETAGTEQLGDLASLQKFVERHEVSEVGRLTKTDLEMVRRVRARLRAIFLAPDQHAAVELVNGLVADARTTPRLTNHDGHPWHVHYFAPGASLGEHIAADGGMALAFVVAANECDRLRVCEAPDCSRVLVDLSRNRCRRYCDSRTCGNRLHVAAYRARRAASGVGVRG
jgi:CGNR zinc finger/Putative stress-induced transcription regulator